MHLPVTDGWDRKGYELEAPGEGRSLFQAVPELGKGFETAPLKRKVWLLLSDFHGSSMNNVVQHTRTQPEPMEPGSYSTYLGIWHSAC